MLFTTLKEKVAARSQGGTASLPGVLRGQDFNRMIERERCRSDRNSHPFSLVVFDPDGKGFPDIRKAAHELKTNVRLTDDVGWFDQASLGVLLPDTSGDGAWSFVHKVRPLLEKADLDLPARVYTYKGNWKDESEIEGPLAEPEEKASSESSPQNKHHFIEDMERFFMKPLPWWKRIEDVVGSLAAMIVFSPLFLTIAVLVKLTSKGPVIFKQLRAGPGGKPFVFYKFRTMYADAEERKEELKELNELDGPVFKIRNDPRITPFGRLLRRSSLDEIPQLWNVFKGDMTLVGPRPPTLDEVPQYRAWHRRRLELTGGITGIWQVSGRNEIPFEEWMRMDVRYSRKRSFLLDIRLLARTVWAVISGRGAN
ncbi:MAG: hypothetical protein GXP54_06205 [Deltaproteobacteria bacterium]|nr:hypothetical protein [Deltaproteobacteria bacterium]